MNEGHIKLVPFLSSLTHVRHRDSGDQWVSLEVDGFIVPQVGQTHPQSLTEPVFRDGAFSPGFNLLHGGSAWYFNHSLHSAGHMKQMATD